MPCLFGRNKALGCIEDGPLLSNPRQGERERERERERECREMPPSSTTASILPVDDSYPAINSQDWRPGFRAGSSGQTTHFGFRPPYLSSPPDDR